MSSFYFIVLMLYFSISANSINSRSSSLLSFAHIAVAVAVAVVNQWLKFTMDTVVSFRPRNNKLKVIECFKPSNNFLTSDDDDDSDTDAMFAWSIIIIITVINIMIDIMAGDDAKGNDFFVVVIFVFFLFFFFFCQPKPLMMKYMLTRSRVCQRHIIGIANALERTITVQQKQPSSSGSCLTIYCFFN